MDSDNPLWGIGITLLLILIMEVIYGMKIALEHVSENSIRKKAELGDKRAAVLLEIMGSDTKHQITLELLLCLFVVTISIYYSTYLLPKIGSDILSNLTTIFLIFIITLLGVVLPKKLAMKYAEKISLTLLKLVKFLSFIFMPFSWVLEKTTFLIFKVFKITPYDIQESEIEDEIISMVNEGHEQGVFDAGKAEMISNIIGLDEMDVQDIMTHKKRIIAVNAQMSLDEALQFMLSGSYSRYPLYSESLDNIIGILHLKDVLGAYISTGEQDITLEQIAREPYFVPDTQSVNLLFHEMQSKHIHMAIVIDEYGQTSGLVAMEDFLEEIVGNIQDEYDEEEKLILSVDKDFCVVKGSISLEDLEDELDISIEHEDFDTLNGLLISILDRIPMDGEKATLQYAGYRFDILDTMDKMIGKVRIFKPPVSLDNPLKELYMNKDSDEKEAEYTEEGKAAR